MFSLLQQQKTESLDFVSFPSHASPLRPRPETLNPLPCCDVPDILINIILINTGDASRRYSAAVCSISHRWRLHSMHAVLCLCVETGLKWDKLRDTVPHFARLWHGNPSYTCGADSLSGKFRFRTDSNPCKLMVDSLFVHSGPTPTPTAMPITIALTV